MEKGVWRTIKGRHVYIRPGESVKDAINRKKQDVENARNDLKIKVETTRTGYERKDTAVKESAEYYNSQPKDYEKRMGLKYRYSRDGEKPKYISKTGEYTENINEAMTVTAQPYSANTKPISNKAEKNGISYYDLETVRVRKWNKTKNIDDLDAQTKYLRQSGNEYLNRGINKDTFNRETGRDAQIDEKALGRFSYQTSKTIAGQEKTNEQRMNSAKQLSSDLDKYYAKNPVKVDESSFRKMDKNLYQNALNDLYLQQIRSEYAQTQLNNIKSKAKANTPDGARNRDILGTLNNYHAKEQIERLNNTTWYEKDGYLTRMNYYPTNERIYADIYNVNPRDDLGYPNVYEKGMTTNEYGVSWSSMGTMSPKDTEEYASRMNKAANYASGLGNVVKAETENFKSRNIWQIEEMFRRQGYSDATAKKMAKEYIKQRKNK